MLFVASSLGITYWAAKRTSNTAMFYTAGDQINRFQNGLALAGDFMSAASFLGIAGLVALNGFDGSIYSIGFLVGWPIVMFLIAEPLRNLGKYTFVDVVAYRLRQTPVRVAAAIGTLAAIAFYLIAQMVGVGNLIRLLFGLDYELAVLTFSHRLPLRRTRGILKIAMRDFLFPRLDLLEGVSPLKSWSISPEVFPSSRLELVG